MKKVLALLAFFVSRISQKLAIFLYRCSEKLEPYAHRLSQKKGIFKDPRDGKTYKTIVIGTQTWLAENLNYKIKGSCCYDNDEFNGDKYGRLYTWKAAMNACPKGWHLPSSEEWSVLAQYVRNEFEKLKATNGWNEYKGSSCNRTDECGFSALPGGYRNKDDGCFYDAGLKGYWWSSKVACPGAIFHCSDNFYHQYGNRSSGYSVRCIKY